MARINIEEEAHKRLVKLADYVGCSRREALGTVGYLWGESQELLKTEGSREEIIDWAGLYSLNESEIEKWIVSLERARFLTLLPSGNYKIHGNETQIEARISRLNKSAKGAEATKRKWNKLKQEGLEQAPSTLEAGDNPGIPMQGNSIQTNAMQASVSELPNATLSFNEKFNTENQAFIEILKNLQIKSNRIVNNISKVREEFQTLDDFEGFIRKISTAETFKKIETAYGKKQYLIAAILRQSGVIGEQNATA